MSPKRYARIARLRRVLSADAARACYCPSRMRKLLILASLLVAAGCQDTEPEPQPVPCGSDTCGVAEYCSGRVCDDIAQRMGQCTTIGTAYACVALPSSCASDATCDCLMSLHELNGLPGATCVAPRTYTSLVF